MDLWLHQMIALERRERWLRAAAQARRADLDRGADGGPGEDRLGPDSPDPSSFLQSLLAPMPVPRAIWWRDGIGLADEKRTQRRPRR